MLRASSVEEQYRQTAADDLRVLVVGAGVAGITVAGLLRGQGRHPVLIERSGPASAGGYMLALMPMVDPAIDALGVRDAYRAASAPLRTYGLLGHRGHRLRSDPLGQILDRYGDYRGIDRGALIDVFSGDDCPVAYDATIGSVAGLDDDPVSVIFHRAGESDRNAYDFDLVILADGIGSRNRRLITGDQPLDEVETGWSGWVVWMGVDAYPDADPEIGEELWGAGFFLGSYPVLDRIGVFLGGPEVDLAAGPRAYVASVRRRLAEISPRTEAALTAVEEVRDPYLWPMSDVRSPRWSRGRAAVVAPVGEDDVQPEQGDRRGS